MVVLAGEELVSLVIDLGSHTTRIGYSGDDTPCLIVPSKYGACADGRLVFGEMGIGFPREGMEIKPIFTTDEQGAVGMDKEGLVALLRWAVEETLDTKGSAHPILLVDSPAWGKELREEIIGILFTDLETPAVFLGRSPVLSAFASGKHTGLIVDLGASAVHVTPVFDGYVVKTACLSQKFIGGDSLTEQCRAMLGEAGISAHTIGHIPLEITGKRAVALGATPDFDTRPLPSASASFRSHQIHRILEDFKESTLQVSESGISNESDLAMRPPRYYEFPTGFNRNFGFERFRLGEILFQPSRYGFSGKDADGDAQMTDVVVDGKGAGGSSSLVTGLTDLIHRSIQACDVDLRPSIVSAVLLCGGGASISGLSERLNADLNRLPTFGRVRVQVPGTTATERRHAAWIGGSILASLGSFQQLWLTKSEFNEHGASYIERKSP